MGSPFFSEKDFFELTEIKGEKIEIRYPAIERESQPEYGFPTQVSSRTVKVPTLIEDNTSRIKIEAGVVKPGQLSAYIARSSLPSYIPPQTTLIYDGTVYQMSDDDDVTVKSKTIIRKFKLEKLPAIASRPENKTPAGDRVTRIPGY
jgi:hypothetical protein